MALAKFLATVRCPATGLFRAYKSGDADPEDMPAASLTLTGLMLGLFRSHVLFSSGDCIEFQGLSRYVPKPFTFCRRPEDKNKRRDIHNKIFANRQNKPLQHAMRNKDAFAGNGPADSVDLLFGPLGRVLRWFGSVWPRSGVFRITPVMTILVGTCTKVQAVKTSIMRKKGGDIIVVRKMVAAPLLILRTP